MYPHTRSPRPVENHNYGYYFRSEATGHILLTIYHKCRLAAGQAGPESVAAGC